MPLRSEGHQCSPYSGADLRFAYGSSALCVHSLREEFYSIRLDINDVDEAFGGENGREEIVAPKNIERLEEISAARNLQRKLEEEK